MRLRTKSGFTLVEVMMALGITVTLFGSMIAAYVAVKSINMMARHKMQAMQIVRGQIENLKASQFSTLANSTSVGVAYDAGKNGTFGNGDDLTGTLTTTIRDYVDFDGDGNTSETQINVDGLGGNDSVAVPVRVQFAWTEWVVGQNKNMTVSADTIIGS
jgi:type II secretory pathway pseudopilin PulG